MPGFLQQLRNLGPGRLAAIAGVGLGLLAFIIYFATRFVGTPMELLFGDLQPADANAVISQLETRNIPFEVRGDGREIFVPADQALRLRIQLAETSLTSGGGASVGYELFDQMDRLGTTNFMQNVNLVRALEGELARTIRALEGVSAARVHLVMPRREMFTRDTQEPSAAIYIKMDRGRLDRQQVTAIQHFVAASVPQLKPTRISIVDERGALLSPGMEDEGTRLMQTQDEIRLREEMRLARAIEDLLERSLGPGKVRAEVRAQIDFDRIVTNEEIYDNEGAVPRSTTSREESLQTSEAEPDAVTVGQNLPDADLNLGAARATASENRLEETTNFEISRRVINQVREGPSLKRLSVAVLVDGTYAPGPDGARQWQPRSEVEMDRIAALVRTAIGFDQARGDQIELVNMQFTDFDFEDVAPPWMFMGFSKDEIMRMVEGLGVAIVAILVILLVVRPLVNRAFEGAQQTAADGTLLTADGLPMGAPQLTGPGGIPAPIPEEEDISEELIDIDKVEGRVKASSLRKIGEIVDKHPDEALAIIRNWLYQEA